MIYKLFNWMFGWDYVLWRNSCDGGISRIRQDRSGVAWYWRYRSTKVVDIVTQPHQVLWLTCEPTKYFKEQKIE